MLIVQISDPHITVPGRNAYGIAPTAEYLARCIDHINLLEPKPDLAMVTGDITNEGKLESTEHAAALLNRLECPFYIIPGNHDDRSVLRSVFGGKSCPSTEPGFINYVIEGHDVRLIAIDSTIPGHAGGRICPARLEWLEQRLQENTSQPTIIFMHHPPVKCSVLETDIDGFDGADELGELIEKFSNIQAVLCGHIHLATHTRWRGTIISTGLSTGMLLDLDLTMKQPSRFFLNMSGYQLHHFTRHNSLITHTINVSEAKNGPYLFEEHMQAGPVAGREK